MDHLLQVHPEAKQDHGKLEQHLCQRAGFFAIRVNHGEAERDAADQRHWRRSQAAAGQQETQEKDCPRIEALPGDSRTHLPTLRGRDRRSIQLRLRFHDQVSLVAYSLLNLLRRSLGHLVILCIDYRRTWAQRPRRTSNALSACFECEGTFNPIASRSRSDSTRIRNHPG